MQKRLIAFRKIRRNKLRKRIETNINNLVGIPDGASAQVLGGRITHQNLRNAGRTEARCFE